MAVRESVEPKSLSKLRLSELRSWGAAALREADIDSWQLDSDLLLGRIAGLSRAQLVARSELLLPPEDISRFRELIDRRARHEPLAYIFGSREFYGRDFHVSPAVLIPRPETELLVARAIDVIRGAAGGISRFIDVGTGSGAVAVTVLAELWSECPRLRAVGIDISLPSLRIAAMNAGSLGVTDRFDPVCSDLLRGLRWHRAGEPFLVTANLPYVPDAETLPRTVELFEPQLALRGGHEGLTAIWRLITEVFAAADRAEGVILLEIGAGQSRLLLSRILQLGGSSVTLHRDLQGIDRVVEIRLRGT